VTHLAERSVLSDQKVGEALTALHRAVAASQFYPQNHPMLREAVAEGLRAFREAQQDYRWEETGLQLRAGALWLGHNRLGEGSPAIGTLAKTFAGHGLAVLRHRGPVDEAAFGHLVSLLATSPDVLAAGGGIAQAWQRSAFSQAFELRGLSVAASASGSPAGAPGTADDKDEWGRGLSRRAEAELLGDPRFLNRLQAFQQRGPQERRALELLLRLGRTEEISPFLERLREITQIVERYVKGERFREAYQVVVFLYREAQNMEAAQQVGKRDYLLDTIRLVLRKEFLQWLIGQVVSRKGEAEEEIGEYILRCLGKAGVVPVINSLVSEGSRLGRRRLVDVLVAMGDVAVPWAVRMLDDQRWFVVRNMVTILGGIGSAESQRALVRLAEDTDPRIRREVARAFGRSRGSVAEEQLLRLLADPDPAVRLMAISSAAPHGSDRLFRALCEILRKTKIGSSEWNLKAGAIRALGRTGREEAIESLVQVLQKRPFWRRERWRALQRATLQALGDLGGDRARDLLAAYREHRDVEFRTDALRALAVAGEGTAAP